MEEKKITSIGGQAIIEGVMMRGPEKIAIAVRKPDGEIIVEDRKVKKMGKISKVPIIRGLVSFFSSMVIGVQALMFSAQFYDTEEETSDKAKKEEEKRKNIEEKLKEEKKEKDSKSEEEKDANGKNDLPGWMMYLSVIVSILISVGLFILLPNFIAGLVIVNRAENLVLYNLVESILRIIIFMGYLILVSRMKDIQRVFEYHGAEHKSIFCYENGEELTVENVKKYSRFHPRCGTSFLLFVMIVSIIVFTLIGRHPNLWINLLNRVIALPLVAGISYEIIRFAGKSKNKCVALLNKPGMWLQRLTTREPDDSQIEVAIRSLIEVIPENKDDDKW